MSLPRRYDSSVERSRARCLRSCVRSRASSGLALSFTSPDGSILLRTSAIWLLNDPQFSASVFSVGKAADAPNRGARQRQRIEKLRKCEQPQRLERAALDRQRRQHRFEVCWRVQRERGIRVEILHAFGRGSQQLRDAVGIGLRLELGQTRRAKRRQRKAAYDLDDPIPLEGAKCTVYASLDLRIDEISRLIDD